MDCRSAAKRQYVSNTDVGRKVRPAIEISVAVAQLTAAIKDLQ
jgi:hypothetical protein